MDKSKSEIAVEYILRRMIADGRLAYFLGYGSQSFSLLTEAYAETNNLDVEEFQKDLNEKLSYEEPLRKD